MGGVFGGLIDIPNWLILVVIFYVTIVEIYEYIKGEKEKGKSFEAYEVVNDLSRSSEKHNNEVTNFIESQEIHIGQQKKNNADTKQFLNLLIDSGTITNTDVINSLEDSKIYLLYVYAYPPNDTTFKLPKDALKSNP